MLLNEIGVSYVPLISQLFLQYDFNGKPVTILARIVDDILLAGP